MKYQPSRLLVISAATGALVIGVAGFAGATASNRPHPAEVEKQEIAESALAEQTPISLEDKTSSLIDGDSSDDRTSTSLEGDGNASDDDAADGDQADDDSNVDDSNVDDSNVDNSGNADDDDSNDSNHDGGGHHDGQDKEDDDSTSTSVAG